jgi:excisionase family DNA binding protein
VKKSIDETKDVMTVAEAADYLQVHIKTLYEWAKSGQLRVIKLGPRSTRILKQDVIRFLEARASTSPDAADFVEPPAERESLARGAKASASAKTRDMKVKISKRG